ncbi:glyoxalase [Streptomyces sp. NPDC048659]|uniref:glyoxalase n=1 Tax=Streptomyces sp. NPDC048659 TaxID=3155489 RepID=UPI003449CC77
MGEAVGIGVRANETAVPVMPCVSVDETLEFYQALGFAVIHEQRRPYVYLAFEWSGFQLHFGAAPKGFDPTTEDGGGCLVVVDDVAAYHAEFTRAMRAAYGKVLAKGRPRITRFRPGASRFTLVDPAGNGIIFIQRDEPKELEYGGAKSLTGLAKAVDNARIFAEFKNDDRTALRVLTTALRKHGDTAPAPEVAAALATLIELATALEETGQVAEWRERLAALDLTDAEQREVEAGLRGAADLDLWRTTTGPDPDPDPAS